MKKFLIILSVIIVLVIAMAGAMFYKIASTPVPVIEIGSVDLNQVRDGSYTGDCDGGIVKATVKVDVADHKITNIKIQRHECGQGKKAEVITDEVIKAQTLKVDTISGATHSSQVLLKAIETALQKGIK